MSDKETNINITFEQLQQLNDTSGSAFEFNEKWKLFGGIPSLVQKLGTSTTSGLPDTSPQHLQKRRDIFGTNSKSLNDISSSPSKSCLQLIWSVCLDRKLLILQFAFLLEFIPLMIALILSLIIAGSVSHDDDEETETTVDILKMMVQILFVPVTLVGIISYINFKTEQEFQQNSRGNQYVVVAKNVQVVRAGETLLINKTDLVVGDLYCIQSGEYIYADGIIIEGHELSLDDSIKIGDILNVENNVVLVAGSGSKVTSGSGKLLVTAVGPNTRLATAIKSEASNTYWKSYPLTEDVRAVSKGIILTGLVLGVIELMLLIVRFSVSRFFIEKQTWHISFSQKYVSFFIFSLSLFMIFLQTSFPFTAVCSQIFAMMKMKKDKVLIKNLDDASILGRITTLVNFGEKLSNGICRSLQTAGITIKTSSDLQKELATKTKYGSKAELRLKLVEDLINSGQIVAVLGQNTSDILALRRSHLGIIIQQKSSSEEIESLISSANIISQPIEDNNGFDGHLDKLLKCINQSRNILINISMYLQWLIPMIVVLGVITLTFSHWFGYGFKSIQIVWLSFIGFGVGFAFAYETPFSDNDCLKGKVKDGLISEIMWKNMFGQIIYQVVVLFIAAYLVHARFLYYDGYLYGDSTVLFATMSFMSIYNVFNCRAIFGERNIFANIWQKSKLLLFNWILDMILQVLILCFGGLVFGISGWATSIFIISLVFGHGTLLWAQIVTTIPTCNQNNSKEDGQVEMNALTNVVEDG